MNTNSKIVLGVVILIAIAGSVAIVRSNAERQLVADREKQDKLEQAKQRELDKVERARLMDEVDKSAALFQQAHEAVVVVEQGYQSINPDLPASVKTKFKQMEEERKSRLANVVELQRNAEAMLKADKAALAKWDAEHPQP